MIGVAIGVPALIVAGAIALLLAATPATALGASIASDKGDHTTGEEVTLTGAGWVPGEEVHLEVKQTSGIQEELGAEPFKFDTSAVANSGGAVEAKFKAPEKYLGGFEVVATGPVSGRAITTFSLRTGLDQCENGSTSSIQPCQTNRWASGNTNRNHAHWAEDEFVPYRAVLQGIAPGARTLVIRFQTVFEGKHAFDYLGSFDATETTSPTGTPFHANKTIHASASW
jgi:hypothetical protein